MSRRERVEESKRAQNGGVFAWSLARSRLHSAPGMLRSSTLKLGYFRSIFDIARRTDVAGDPLEARMGFVVAKNVALVLSPGLIEWVAEIAPETVIMGAITRPAESEEHRQGEPHVCAGLNRPLLDVVPRAHQDRQRNEDKLFSGYSHARQE